MQKKFCSHCGARLREESNFCGKCGSDIGNRNEPEQDKVITEQVKEKKDNKMVYLLGSIIFILLLVGIAVWGTTQVRDATPPKLISPSPKTNVTSPPPPPKNIDISQYGVVAYDKMVVYPEKYFGNKIWLSGTIEAILNKNGNKEVVLVVSPKTEMEPKRVAVGVLANDNGATLAVGERVKMYGIFQRVTKEYSNYAPQVAQLPVLMLDVLTKE